MNGKRNSRILEYNHPIRLCTHNICINACIHNMIDWFMRVYITEAHVMCLELYLRVNA